MSPPTITLLAGDPAKAAHLHREVIAGRDDVAVPAFVAWMARAEAELPAGIARHADAELEAAIQQHAAAEVILCTHGISLPAMRGFARRVESAGAEWVLPGSRQLMRRVPQPVIAVTALSPAASNEPVIEGLLALLDGAGIAARAMDHAGVLAAGRTPLPSPSPSGEGEGVIVLDAGTDTPWLEPDCWVVASASSTKVSDWYWPAKDAAETCDAFVCLSLDASAPLPPELAARNPDALRLSRATLASTQSGQPLLDRLRASTKARGKRLA